MVSESRIAEYEVVRSLMQRWAAAQPDIVCVAIVGSWARGDAREESDVDFVVLTPTKALFTADDGWIEDAVGQIAPVVRRAEWGVLTERRLRLPSGFEIEVGFVEPSWADVHPLDPGTAHVVSSGFTPVYDPDGLLERLAKAN